MTIIGGPRDFLIAHGWHCMEERSSGDRVWLHPKHPVGVYGDSAAYAVHRMMQQDAHRAKFQSQFMWGKAIAEALGLG